MRYVRSGPQFTAIAAAMAVASMVAGCAGATPASGPTSAHPVSAHPVAAAASVGAGAGGTVPAVFAASVSFASPNADRGDLGERIALLSSRTGHLLRWLTSRQDGTFDAVLSVHDGWVYFLRGVASVSVWRVPVAGGRAQLVQVCATRRPLAASTG